MKKVILAVLAALVMIPMGAQASDVAACGANPARGQLFGPYRSDPGGGNSVAIPASTSDLRAVVVRSSKGTTRIQYLSVYDANTRSWRLLVGSQIILSEDNEYMICIPRRWSISQVQVDTSGGDKAKFRVYMYYR